MFTTTKKQRKVVGGVAGAALAALVGLGLSVSPLTTDDTHWGNPVPGGVHVTADGTTPPVVVPHPADTHWG
ncbi:hypothetical protein [Streptomyces rubellomurinus]|uniref:Uncharacterized protein n=2 Tax=Streptomyces TaxID=1883 RepID=A0A0F2T805_STRR3|nr:hypothetical protein [Streptomyces rubellomurinus]KJS58531.1 hypothetical protein VM95_32615 [Streptomyces rubellomurinus]